MGYTPAQVNDMSLWEFASCVSGYRRAHSPEERPEPPTPEEFDKMVARHNSLTRH